MAITTSEPLGFVPRLVIVLLPHPARLTRSVAPCTSFLFFYPISSPIHAIHHFCYIYSHHR